MSRKAQRSEKKTELAYNKPFKRLGLENANLKPSAFLLNTVPVQMCMTSKVTDNTKLYSVHSNQNKFVCHMFAFIVTLKNITYIQAKIDTVIHQFFQDLSLDNNAKVESLKSVIRFH